MSRILVTGAYEDGKYVLRYAEDPEEGTVFLAISHGDVFSVGNSIGGWYARQVQYAGETRIALHHISGKEKGLNGKALERVTRGQKGFVLRPMTGLWATSSGSAKRGLFHRVDGDATPNPVVDALRRARMPSDLLREVESIDMGVMEGGTLCRHSTGQDTWYGYETDGTPTTVHEAGWVTDHGNQYHNGCKAGTDDVHVGGGTYVVEWMDRKGMGGGGSRSIQGVTVSGTADHEKVAAIIKQLMT